MSTAICFIELPIIRPDREGVDNQLISLRTIEHILPKKGREDLCTTLVFADESTMTVDLPYKDVKGRIPSMYLL